MKEEDLKVAEKNTDEIAGEDNPSKMADAEVDAVEVDEVTASENKITDEEGSAETVETKMDAVESDEVTTSEVIEPESIDDIQLLEEKNVSEEDKYIKLTPRRFYTSIIVAPILVFITMLALIFGGNYLYQEAQINKQVDEMIQNVLASSSNGRSVDSALAKDMIAVIDYKGTVDGKEFDGGTGENYSLVLGSGTFIDDFEDQLIGHKKGDEVSVKVTFPDDYTTADLAGKDAVFKVTINDVQEQVENKLNDEFAESLGIPNVTTVEQLKEYLRNYIKTQGSSSSY